MQQLTDLFRVVEHSQTVDRITMVSRDVLHELVDSLPQAEIATAERFLTIISKEPIGPEFKQLGSD